MTEEVTPYIKEHDGSHICFADTLTQAKNALTRETLADDADPATLDEGHLMLFGVEDWKIDDIGQLTEAMSGPGNTFKRLEVFGCEISGEMQTAFAESLANGNIDSVDRLDIDNTQLTPDGAEAIFTAVAEAQNIKTLNLQGSIPSAEVLNAINGALIQECNLWQTLEMLDLKINDIKEAGCEAVAEIMQKMTEHEKVELDLFYNDIEAGGAAHVGRALQEPECFITHLDLCCNNIGDEGAMAIGAALRTNGTLQVLKLALNNIGNDGASAIWAAIAPLKRDPNQARNKCLRILDMSANVVKEETGIAVDGPTPEQDAEIMAIDEKLAELVNDDEMTDEQLEERKQLEIRRGELEKGEEDRPVVTQLCEVLLRGFILEEFDFTGIEFDNKGWNVLGRCFKSTTTNLGREKELMKIKFSIVDLMSQTNLGMMEDFIWNENLKETYKHIDWRRREAPADAAAA